MTKADAQLREEQFDMVHDSQKTFRIMMMALAFPGIIRRLSPISLSISNPDMRYILQPLLTILDLETTFCIVCRDEQLRKEILRYIELNTSAQHRKLNQADFVLCLDSSLNGSFLDLKIGSLTQPHKGATAFYLLDRLAERPHDKSLELRLTGPGIENVQTVYVSGLESVELKHWGNCKYDYPMGIDIYLVSRSGHIVGIPRSVDINDSGGR